MIRKIFLGSIFFLQFFGNTIFAQIPISNFLQGTWKMENRETYEHWNKLDDSSFNGFSYQLKNGEMKVSEFLSISANSDKIIYTATVIDQNQGKGIPFSLTESDSAYVFENPSHDFPKRIIYQPLNQNQVKVTVSDGSKKGFSYILSKVTNQINISNSTSKVDTLQSGELMLTQEIIINAPVEKLWNAYTTAESWKEWVTPIVEMDFKINGTIKSHYDPKAKIGDKGTIVIHILNYIPNKQITLQAEVAENFPEFMKGEEKNLYSIVEFTALNGNTTKVTLYGIGYKNEQRWLDLMKFFIQGNEMTLNNLKKYAEN